MSSTVTSDKSPVFAIADLLPRVGGGELTVVSNDAPPLAKALDAMVDVVAIDHGVRDTDQRAFTALGIGLLGSLATMVGVLGVGIPFTMDVLGKTPDGSGMLTAMAVGIGTSIVGATTWCVNAARRDRAKLEQLAPKESLSAIEATPLQRAMLATTGSRFLQSTFDNIPSKAWQARFTVPDVTLSPEHRAALDVVYQAIFGRHSLDFARDIGGNLDALRWAIERLPPEELPAVRQFVEHALTRAGVQTPAPNTCAWYQWMPIHEALVGKCFRFSEHLGSLPPAEGRPPSPDFDLSLARVDFILKHHRAGKHPFVAAQTFVVNLDDALRLAAHFEAQGLRISVMPHGAATVSVAVYEPGECPPLGLHTCENARSRGAAW